MVKWLSRYSTEQVMSLISSSTMAMLMSSLINCPQQLCLPIQQPLNILSGRHWCCSLCGDQMPNLDHRPSSGYWIGNSLNVYCWVACTAALWTTGCEQSHHVLLTSRPLQHSYTRCSTVNIEAIVYPMTRCHIFITAVGPPAGQHLQTPSVLSCHGTSCASIQKRSGVRIKILASASEWANSTAACMTQAAQPRLIGAV